MIHRTLSQNAAMNERTIYGFKKDSHDEHTLIRIYKSGCNVHDILAESGKVHLMPTLELNCRMATDCSAVE